MAQRLNTNVVGYGAAKEKVKIDRNSMSSKLGLNFNFTLGESKAWTLAVKPALVKSSGFPSLSQPGYP